VIDVVNRERMFQDIEGLLRQIRERAEETAEWTDAVRAAYLAMGI